LVEAVRAGTLGRGRTLGGCQILSRQGQIRVVREAAAISEEIEVSRSGNYQWDGRFQLRLEDLQSGVELRLGALGEAGWAALTAENKSLKSFAIPAAARAALPVLRDLDGAVNVYHLLYRRKGADPDSVRVVSAVFRPRQPLAGAEFTAFQPSPHPWGKPKAPVAE